MKEALATKLRRPARLIGTLVVLSTGFAMTPDAQTSVRRAHQVPLFPTASDAYRQGFVRIINHLDDSGEVTIYAIDDTGYQPPAITLMLQPKQTVHFNSNDLEDGNDDKRLSGGVGVPQGGDWRLLILSGLDIEVLAYIRHNDGFLTAMHDTAPASFLRVRVPVFNPGQNPDQVSRLRLVNPGQEDAQVAIVGIDDDGESPGETVEVTVAAGQTRTLSAHELEENSSGDFVGALGNGKGKWQLNITSSQPIVVMSLMDSVQTNQLTNLSTSPERPMRISAREWFDSIVSPTVVETNCVTCHVQDGSSAHTSLVFVRSSDDDDHLATNFGVFKDYLAAGPIAGASPSSEILNKIQGHRAHGGGQRVAVESEVFLAMHVFLATLAAEVAAEASQTGG